MGVFTNHNAEERSRPFSMVAPNSIGYSDRINSHELRKYLKRKSLKSNIPDLILYSLSLCAFYYKLNLYKEYSLNYESNGLYFLLLASPLLLKLYSILSRPKLKIDWEGVIVDKQITSQKVTSVDGEYSYYDTTFNQTQEIPTLIFQSSKGRKIKQSVSRDVYDYYETGDNVRCFVSFEYVEKYNKRKDSKLICIKCASVFPLGEEYCPKCGLIAIK